MKLTKRNFDDVKDLSKLGKEGYKFGLIYHLDEILTGEIENLSMDEERLIEARIFCEDKEIHIFNNDGFRAIEAIDEKSKEEENDSYYECHLLIDKETDKKSFGKNLTVKRYIDFDEDGQAYISYTRLYSIELGGEK